uniref:Uncharacterized protein n=1 Tax=Anabas testudineus TaxID=64144 RepID=A0A7N6A723_ANATE
MFGKRKPFAKPRSHTFILPLFSEVGSGGISKRNEKINKQTNKQTKKNQYFLYGKTLLFCTIIFTIYDSNKQTTHNSHIVPEQVPMTS